MIIVLGASGFIGTYLIDQLIRDGYSVIAADVSETGRSYYESIGIPYLVMDITDRADFKQLPADNIDAVINLACVQPANVSKDKYDPVDFIKVNVIGMLNVLDFCQKNDISKIVYTCSHRNTQGLWIAKEGHPIKESDGRSIKYTGDYSMFSISESASTDCIEYYVQTYGLQGIILRLPPVYGYGPHTEIFKDGEKIITGFQRFIENAKKGIPLEIWGDCTLGRDIIYIKDVVSALIQAVKSQNAIGLYNIASGKRLTLKEEAESIALEFWPKGSIPEFLYRPEKPNNIEQYCYDIDRAEKELGWHPVYSFPDMITDYKKEAESKKFIYLIEKRKNMMNDDPTL